MKKNFISILITNYNKAQFLKRSLNSVFNQNFKNYEIILYDDCSNDSSIKIINNFKKIKLIRNLKRNNKNSSPLNQITGILQAFKKCKGNIICLMDADDSFVKNKLSIINKIFEINKSFNCVFNIPKNNQNQFKFKNKINNISIWPTIFPTSCISFRRNFFKKFIQYSKKNKLPNLEIDARVTIFSKFFVNEYNIINKKLTFYDYDHKGITANIKKFSKFWWIRRREAYIYLKYIMKKKKAPFKASLDYYITFILSCVYKFIS